MTEQDVTAPALDGARSDSTQQAARKARPSRSKEAVAARAAEKAKAAAIAEPAPKPAKSAKAKPAGKTASTTSEKGSPPPMSSRVTTGVKSVFPEIAETSAPVAAPTPTAPMAEAAPSQAEIAERSSIPPPGPRPVLPQRAIAKAENFKEGDFVVYPTHGVGKVERIAPEEIAGHKLDLIHITFDENRMTLRVPVNKARTAGLRKLASRKQFDEVLVTLKGRARIKRTMWSRRAQEYEAKINSGDPMAIAEVVRDLHRNAGQPDQSFSERQIFEAALERLAAEYAALESLTKLEAIDKLLVFLKTE